MEDGKLPPGLSEDRLIEIGATVLAVKSGETLPCIITQTQKRQYLQWGISEEKLEKAGYIIVDDAVIVRGRAERDRIIQERLQKTPNTVQPQQLIQFSWTNIFEAWPPGSNNVSSSAVQWALLPGLMRERGRTFDWDWFIVVWQDDKSGWGWSHGIGGTVPGVDGHFYSLDAWYWYEGVLWDTGSDAMRL